MGRTFWTALLLTMPAFAQAPYRLVLDPPTIPAGGPGFILSVAFAGNSTLTPIAKASWVVRWDGIPRPTHANANSIGTGNILVQADIPASDIARPGFAEVSILDTATNAVYPVNAYFAASVDITAADFVYDSVRNRFYVTVAAGGSRPNAPAESVIAVDPITGALGPALNVGPKPTQLAISDDARYLYVYLASSSAVARVALSTFTPDLQFPLTGSAQTVLSMAVMPGSAGTLAVSQTAQFANSGRVVIYDDGKSRAQASADLLAANLLFADASTIVTGGYVGPMNILKVSGGGIASATPISATNQQEVPVAASANLVFASSSGVYNLQTLQLVGRTGMSGSAAFLPGRGRLLIAGPVDNNGGVQLAAFDQTTLTALGQMPVGASYAGIGNFRARLVPWGLDGIAFVSGEKLVMGHTPLAGPAPTWSAAGTVNASSETAGAIAPGEIVSIFGANLGLAAGRSLEFSGRRQVSTNLAGTQVWFDGLAGTMLYAGAGQVNTVVPYGLAGKTSTRVQLWNGGIPSAAVTLAVVPVAPGIFTQDGSGRGPAALLNADGNLNTAARPAAAGSYATLFGTGGGVTTPPGHDGVPPVSADVLAAAVRILLNGQPVPVIYAGSAPGLVAGVVQVNFQIPADFSATPAATLQLEIGGVASPSAVTMAVR